MFRDCEDVRLARRVARCASRTTKSSRSARNSLRAFRTTPNARIYLTEGGIDVYRASDLYVSERARQMAPVKVVGTYGSEIVRHAVMFKPKNPVRDLFSPNFLPSVEQAGYHLCGHPAAASGYLRGFSPISLVPFAHPIA